MYWGLRGGGVQGDVKPPTLGTFPPPELTCVAPSGRTTGSSLLLMGAVCMLSMSYVTYSINVVSFYLTCNKHLLYVYTISYSLISKGKGL